MTCNHFAEYNEVSSDWLAITSDALWFARICCQGWILVIFVLSWLRSKSTLSTSRALKQQVPCPRCIIRQINLKLFTGKPIEEMRKLGNSSIGTLTNRNKLTSNYNEELTFLINKVVFLKIRNAWMKYVCMYSEINLNNKKFKIRWWKVQNWL